MKTLHQIPTALRQRAVKWISLLLLAAVGAGPVFAATPVAPSSGVPYVKALTDANRVAGMHDRWSVYRAHGQSMVPQFGDSSLLLVEAVNFEQLKAGMLVVYKDRDGDLVAHRLVAQSVAGWTAKGLNNENQDPGLVTAENLHGVVFGIFNYKTGTENLAALSAATQPPVAYAKKY